jgi:hypothetical protein
MELTEFDECCIDRLSRQRKPEPLPPLFRLSGLSGVEICQATSIVAPGITRAIVKRSTPVDLERSRQYFRSDGFLICLVQLSADLFELNGA